MPVISWYITTDIKLESQIAKKEQQDDNNKR
jgi:hypothetical protein